MSASRTRAAAAAVFGLRIAYAGDSALVSAGPAALVER
jgi:hypothetical protein